MKVTPWEVSGKIDYDKLIKEFGVKPLPDNLPKQLTDNILFKRKTVFAHRDFEKITDCILCWTMPLYWGNSCTNLYLPEKSFHLINIENKDIFKNIQNIISKAPTDEEVNALTKAREIILDKLNIWEQIYQIINNYDTFLKEYKLY